MLEDLRDISTYTWYSWLYRVGDNGYHFQVLEPSGVRVVFKSRSRNHLKVIPLKRAQYTDENDMSESVWNPRSIDKVCQGNSSLSINPA